MGAIRAVILYLSVFFIFKIYAISPSIRDRNTRIEPFVSVCRCATKPDPAKVQEWLLRRVTYTDPCMGCFYLCLGISMGLLHPNGTFNIDAWYIQYGGLLPMKDLLACNKIHGPNPDHCARASVFLQCNEDALSRNPIAENP